LFDSTIELKPCDVLISFFEEISAGLVLLLLVSPHIVEAGISAPKRLLEFLHGVFGLLRLATKHYFD
jgi:hypothetical protein